MESDFGGVGENNNFETQGFQMELRDFSPLSKPPAYFERTVRAFFLKLDYYSRFPSYVGGKGRQKWRERKSFAANDKIVCEVEAKDEKNVPSAKMENRPRTFFHIFSPL